MKISLFYNNITVLDYAFIDHNRGIIGDSLKVNIELIGRTDDEGVIFDFSLAKKKIKEIIDLECDHRLIVPKNSFKFIEDQAILSFHYGKNSEQIIYKCPREAICEISSSHVDNAGIQYYLESLIMEQMPKTVEAVKISFNEEESSENHEFFQYTHGLKQHYGNCQRLFHGHRSTVEVFIAGQRSYEVEKWLTQEVFSSNIHFLLTENIANLKEIQEATASTYLEGRYFDIPDFEIEYTSKQGKYYGKIPCEMAYVMNQETTVENLSIHFLNIIQKETGLNTGIQVNAFEGIGKGASSSV